MGTERWLVAAHLYAVSRGSDIISRSSTPSVQYLIRVLPCAFVHTTRVGAAKGWPSRYRKSKHEQLPEVSTKDVAFLRPLRTAQPVVSG